MSYRPQIGQSQPKIPIHCSQVLLPPTGAVANVGLRLDEQLRALLKIWIAEDNNPPAASTYAGQTTTLLAPEQPRSSGWLIAFVVENGAFFAACVLLTALWIRWRSSHSHKGPNSFADKQEDTTEMIILPRPNEARSHLHPVLVSMYTSTCIPMQVIYSTACVINAPEIHFCWYAYCIPALIGSVIGVYWIICEEPDGPSNPP